MNNRFLMVGVMMICTAAWAQPPATGPATAPTAGARRGGRGPNVRNPLADGMVKATELPDGQIPPMEANGNFIIGPTHEPAPEMSPVSDPNLKGTIHRFTLTSAESKFYPGIARDTEAAPTPDPNDPTRNLVVSKPQPWSRTVSVYVPKQYVPGTVAPFLVTTDGDNRAFNVLDHLIPQKKLPVMIVVAIQNGGGDGPGSQRGLEYDTMSPKYGDFVENEVLPMAEKTANVKLTKDPDGRAVAGTSSGASASLIMAWFHTDRYHRVLTFSGTFVNQQSPTDPQYPYGAWGLHETLIPNSPAKPLRIYMEVGDSDNMGRTFRHDWVMANNNMAKVLAEKGYQYKYVFARGAGHTHRPTISQLYPTALQWVWQGYPIEGK